MNSEESKPAARPEASATAMPRPTTAGAVAPDPSAAELVPETDGDGQRQADASLQRCEVCGNDYDKCIEVLQAGRRHVFDCFECAAHALAPSCAHCGCRILGHGMEHGGEMYCCAHCGQARGVEQLQDRA